MLHDYTMRILCCVAAYAFSSASVSARTQVIDAALEAVTGPLAASADLKVAVVEGGAAIFADEKWEVVGACSNKPNLRVEFVTGIAAIFVETTVEIVTGVMSLSADQRICITNSADLTDELRLALKLREDE